MKYNNCCTYCGIGLGDTKQDNDREHKFCFVCDTELLSDETLDQKKTVGHIQAVNTQRVLCEQLFNKWN